MTSPDTRMYGMHVLYYLPHVLTYLYTSCVQVHSVCTVGLCVCSCTCTILYLLYSKYSIILYVQYSMHASCTLSKELEQCASHLCLE